MECITLHKTAKSSVKVKWSLTRIKELLPSFDHTHGIMVFEYPPKEDNDKVRKTCFQGEFRLERKYFNKIEVSTNPSIKETSLFLLPVPTISKKLCNPYTSNTPSSELSVSTGMNTRSKTKLNSNSSKISSEHNNNSSVCDSYVRITTKALIEPLPECRGKCSVPFKQSKRIKKLQTVKKVDLDEIKIVSSSDGEPTINKNKRKIHLTRTLVDINGRNNITPIFESFPVQTITQNEDDENNNNNTKEPVKKKRKTVTNKPKIKTTQRSIQTRSKKLPKVDTDDKEDQFQNATLAKYPAANQFDGIDSLIESIRNTYNNSITSPKTKNRTIRKRIHKTYSGNMIKRNRQLSVESILDENELNSLIKKYKDTSIKNNKKHQLKFVQKPVKLKPIGTERKSSTGSSFLPELEIEVEKPPSPFVSKRFSDSDVLFEENMPVPKIQILSNICIKDKVPCVPVHSDLDVHVKNNLEVIQDYSDAETLMNTPIDLSTSHPSSTLSNLPNQPVNESIVRWLQTSDLTSTEAEILRLVDAGLSIHANLVQLLVGLVDDGPAKNPLLCELDNILMKHESTLDEYFKKKK